MLTLYHCPRTRSSRFIWLLEELGVPYQIKRVSIRRSDGTGEADPANPHPHAKVPSLEHDGVTIFESPAIALYLTDAFPAKGIGAEIGDPRRGPYLSWLAYYGSVFEPSVMSKFMKTDVPRGSAGWVDLDETMAFIDRTLQEGPYLVGDKFSGADVLFASTFALFANSPLLPQSEARENYVRRCIERPAHARSQTKDGG
ncbi:MAG TPA: glutathione S-transferase family protein [Rhizomicrobium sp.]|jgi:glutathione S-transferase